MKRENHIHTLMVVVFLISNVHLHRGQNSLTWAGSGSGSTVFSQLLKISKSKFVKNLNNCTQAGAGDDGSSLFFRVKIDTDACLSVVFNTLLMLRGCWIWIKNRAEQSLRSSQVEYWGLRTESHTWSEAFCGSWFNHGRKLWWRGRFGENVRLEKGPPFSRGLRYMGSKFYFKN